ncbi:MAG: hypothetical protein GWP05_01205 [Anaerolineaceae bacterium]|nr:hypothetical protein [Anaerolineaceae bacterium]
MFVERSILQPIFAGTQSAALDKSENPEAPDFQQQFAETVEAMVSGGRTLQHGPIEQEIAGALPEIETPPGQDEGQAAAETKRAESAETVALIAAGELAPDAPREPLAARLPETELQTAPAKEATERAAVRPTRVEYVQRKTSMLQELQRTDGALAELMIASPEQTPEADVAVDAMIVPAAEPEVVAIAEPEIAAKADPELVPVVEVETAVMAEPQVAVQKKDAESPVVLPPPAEIDVKVPTVQLSADVETEPAPVVEIEFAAAVTSEAAAEQATGLQQQEPAPRVAPLTPRRRTVRHADAGTEDSAARGDKASSARPARQAGSPPAEQAISDGPGGRRIQAEVVSIQVVGPGPGPGGDGRDDALAMRAGPVALGPELQPEPAGSLGVERRSQQSDPHEQVERIVRVMRASISRGGSRVTLRLSPPSLGPLRIQMQIRNDELIARFETQTEAARSWVSSQLGSLREALAAQNIRLVGESVETQGQADSSADSSNEQAGQQGDFSAGAQAGRRQSQEQRAAGGELRTEADVPQWAETQADDNRVNVVA